MLPQKKTAPAWVSGNDAALNGVPKTADDAEHVSRKSDTQCSSNAPHIISFQEANCCVVQHACRSALRNGAHNNRSKSASNNQNIKFKHSVHH